MENTIDAKTQRKMDIIKSAPKNKQREIAEKYGLVM